MVEFPGDELRIIDGDSTKPDAKFNFVGNFFMAQMMVFQALSNASPNAYYAVKGFQSMLVGWADKCAAYKVKRDEADAEYAKAISEADKISEGFKRAEIVTNARLTYATTVFDELMRHVVFPQIIGQEHTIAAKIDYGFIEAIRNG